MQCKMLTTPVSGICSLSAPWESRHNSPSSLYIAYPRMGHLKESVSCYGPCTDVLGGGNQTTR